MPTTAHASVVSSDAPRLLRTLVNHWRHKFEIRRDDDAHAHVPFTADGGADFRVAGERLEIALLQPDDAGRARYRQVIENHLQRFARGETLAFDWQER